ncbi:MAG: hypothetical protein AAGI51_16375 [Pseudomonadota bacterium]
MTRLAGTAAALVAVMLCAGARVYSVTAISVINEGLVSAPSNVVLLGAEPGEGAAALRLPGQFGGGGFTVVDPRSGGVRLVIAVGGASPSEMCGGGSAPGPGAGRITAAWCFDATVLANGTAEDPAFDDPSKAAFGKQANELIREMLLPGPGTPRGF